LPAKRSGPEYRTAPTPPIRSWRGCSQFAAIIFETPSLRSNGDFQDRIRLSWSLNWHKEKTRRVKSAGFYSRSRQKFGRPRLAKGYSGMVKKSFTASAAPCVSGDLVGPIRFNLLGCVTEPILMQRRSERSATNRSRFVGFYRTSNPFVRHPR
jgi:hypothetical protein